MLVSVSHCLLPLFLRLDGLELTQVTLTGFITLAMGMICVVFLICSLRTNIVFFLIFLTLVAAFGLITAAYWFLAMDYTGNAAYAAKLLQVSLEGMGCVRN